MNKEEKKKCWVKTCAASTILALFCCIPTLLLQRYFDIFLLNNVSYSSIESNVYTINCFVYTSIRNIHDLHRIHDQRINSQNGKCLNVVLYLPIPLKRSDNFVFWHLIVLISIFLLFFFLLNALNRIYFCRCFRFFFYHLLD